MKKTLIYCLLSVAGAILLSATNGFSFGSFGNDVNSLCTPAAPYTGNCALCHTADRGDPTPAKEAYNAGGTALTDFFCPPTTPTCTDNDGDSFAVEGGDCGPIDCNDGDPAINPGAAENCSDNIDNNCNDLVDEQDPSAVGCLVCTDSDGDTFAAEGGECGTIDCNDANSSINPDAFDIPNNGVDEDCSGADSVDPTLLDNDGDTYSQAAGDCDDTNPSINPGAFDIPNNGIDENCDGADSIDTTNLDSDGDGFTPATGDCDDTDGTINPDAVEVCIDGIDNNCNGLVDVQDPNAVDCPFSCFDSDGDTYAIDGGDCGPIDCDDNDGTVNPGAEEVCDDNKDNDCDGTVDEGCDTTCPDADGDGYMDSACGGLDCNDNDAAIHPGADEVCGNNIDENCNGTSDDVCLSCPDGTLLVVKEVEYNRGDRELKIKGRATAGTTVSIIDADTGDVLKSGINVRKGKWKTEIKRVSRSLKNVTVITSNGCAVDAPLGSGGDDSDDSDDEDDDDDDDDDEREDRKRSGSRRN